MGDRSNLFFRAKGGGVGIYGHWTGLAMADVAVAVLSNEAFRVRIGDVSYAMRIGVHTALDNMGVSATDETGCGLWTPATGADDNEYPYVVIDVTDGAVYVTNDYNAPAESDRVEDPTVEAIRNRMSGG